MNVKACMHKHPTVAALSTLIYRTSKIGKNYKKNPRDNDKCKIPKG